MKIVERYFLLTGKQAVFLAFALMTLPMTTAADDQDVERTWNHADLGIPAAPDRRYAAIGNFSESRMQSAWEVLGESAVAPAVILLHGCKGITEEEKNYLYLLTTAGYFVVAPDSYSRRNRQSACDDSRKIARVVPKVYAMRQQELRYSLQRLQQLPWIDQQRIYLIGFSEGGAAAAQYDGTELAAVVIVGWHCNGPGFLSELRTSASTPVLSILWENDPWYIASRGQDCGDKFTNPRHSRAIILGGSGHSVFGSAPQAIAQNSKKILLDFLQLNSKTGNP